MNMVHVMVFFIPGSFFFLICFSIAIISVDRFMMVFFNTSVFQNISELVIFMHCTCLNQVLVQIQLSDT